MSPEQTQYFMFVLYLVYTVLLVFEPKINNNKRLRNFVETIGFSGVTIAALFYLNQALNSNSLLGNRVVSAGVHSINLVIFCIAYYVYAFLPDRNGLRGMTLVLYTIGLHEILWNLFYYGLVRPELATYFIQWSNGVLFLLGMTAFYAFVRYKKLIAFPTLLSVVVLLFYLSVWMSIGFPITVSTFDVNYLTPYFGNLKVDIIEFGSIFSFNATFLSSYLGMRFQHEFT